MEFIMKKLFFLSFLLVSLTVRTNASSRKSIPTSDLDFDFLKVKTKELLNDAIASAILFDEKIIRNGDEGEFEEMPTTRLRIGLEALANGDRERFGKKFEEFENDIDEGNQRYEENNTLMFGPLNEIDRAVGNFGNLISILHYPVLTTAKPNREVMLPKKDGTADKTGYLENEEEVQELTRQSIYEVAREIMMEGLGRSLNGGLK